MKIAFAIASLRSGGAERVITNVANLFAENGHEVTLIVFDDAESFYPISKRIRIKTISPFRPANKIASGFLVLKILFALRKELSSDRPDALVSFLTLTNILCIVAAKLCKIPVYISERIGLDYRPGWLVEQGRKYLYRFAQGIVFQTKRIINSYEENKISLPHKVAVIQNPLPQVFYVNPSKTVQKSKIILGVGRLETQKGFDMLIRAFAKINRSNRDWKIHIVGNGTQKGQLQALSASLLGNQILFSPSLKNLQPVYEESSIFVLSSRFEGFPNVLCEAMACGCACISFDCDFGPAEIIEHGENGLLVKRESEDLLAQSLDTLIHDEALRNSISGNARKIRRKMNPQSIYTQWKELIIA